jgi:hypothetical protein
VDKDKDSIHLTLETVAYQYQDSDTITNFLMMKYFPNPYDTVNVNFGSFCSNVDEVSVLLGYEAASQAIGPLTF